MRDSEIDSPSRNRFAWRRRVNENNVDLNRNMRWPGEETPASGLYGTPQPALSPTRRDEPTLAHANNALARFKPARGTAAFQRAVSLGQYDYPDGLFYGGASLEWSNRGSH